ncbi:hypothetical protein BDZ45DRAFT_738298 [Acephala macrosclerotiorum]|nr:hypothetical protein BDZ45DRAFT_738298 [Acephala macrosclerotiorum]
MSYEPYGPSVLTTPERILGNGSRRLAVRSRKTLCSTNVEQLRVFLACKQLAGRNLYTPTPGPRRAFGPDETSANARASQVPGLTCRAWGMASMALVPGGHFTGLHGNVGSEAAFSWKKGWEFEKFDGLSAEENGIFPSAQSSDSTTTSKRREYRPGLPPSAAFTALPNSWAHKQAQHYQLPSTGCELRNLYDWSILHTYLFYGCHCMAEPAVGFFGVDLLADSSESFLTHMKGARSISSELDFIDCTPNPIDQLFVKNDIRLQMVSPVNLLHACSLALSLILVDLVYLALLPASMSPILQLNQ